MHNGYEHLISNTFILIIIGLPLELIHKWYRLLSIFAVGSIVGNRQKTSKSSCRFHEISRSFRCAPRFISQSVCLFVGPSESDNFIIYLQRNRFYEITPIAPGCLFHSVTDAEFSLVGASGGVYAILAAHCANCVINYREMVFNWIRILLLW